MHNMKVCTIFPQIQNQQINDCDCDCQPGGIYASKCTMYITKYQLRCNKQISKENQMMQKSLMKSFSQSHQTFLPKFIFLCLQGHTPGCYASFFPAANASDLQMGHTFFTNSHFFKHSAWYSCPQSRVPIFSWLLKSSCQNLNHHNMFSSE